VEPGSPGGSHPGSAAVLQDAQLFWLAYLHTLARVLQLAGLRSRTPWGRQSARKLRAHLDGGLLGGAGLYGGASLPGSAAILWDAWLFWVLGSSEAPGSLGEQGSPVALCSPGVHGSTEPLVSPGVLSSFGMPGSPGWPGSSGYTDSAVWMGSEWPGSAGQPGPLRAFFRFF
jgi:hypothetical protein